MEYILGWQDDFSNKNSSANFSANSSCPSSPETWCFGDSDESSLCIQNPALIPTCVLALIIGLFSSKRISRLRGKFLSRWFYQVAFFLYGIMMTTAGILHCFIGDAQKSSETVESTGDDSIQFLRLLFGVLDVGLTTNIAITILFCGLCDIKFFNPQSAGTRYFLYILYFFVFVLWTLGITNQWKWTFHVLYFGVISICCLVYLLTQLCVKSNRRALPVLVVAGLYGAFGLFATSFAAERICESEGPFWSLYFGPEFIWFLFSDISMAFVFIYVLRANQERNIKVKQYDTDLEKHPEKF